MEEKFDKDLVSKNMKIDEDVVWKNMKFEDCLRMYYKIQGVPQKMSPFNF